MIIVSIKDFSFNTVGHLSKETQMESQETLAFGRWVSVIGISPTSTGKGVDRIKIT